MVELLYTEIPSTLSEQLENNGFNIEPDDAVAIYDILIEAIVKTSMVKTKGEGEKRCIITLKDENNNTLLSYSYWKYTVINKGGGFNRGSSFSCIFGPCTKDSYFGTIADQNDVEFLNSFYISEQNNNKKYHRENTMNYNNADDIRKIISISLKVLIKFLDNIIKNGQKIKINSYGLYELGTFVNSKNEIDKYIDIDPRVIDSRIY